MRDSQIKKIGSWRYAACRIRAQESCLFDLAGIRGLATITSEDDLRQHMRQHDYKDAASAIVMLQQEEQAIWQLADHVAYDKRFLQIFLRRNDAHNLKVVLRTFAHQWLSQTKETTKQDTLFAAVKEQFMHPTTLKLEQLFDAVKMGKLKDIAKSYQEAVQAALDIFAKSASMALIDATIDNAIEVKIQAEAAELDNKWLLDLLAIQRDYKNLEMLLRCRTIAAPSAFLESQLLVQGKIDHKAICSWFELDSQNLGQKLVKFNVDSGIVAAVTQYGEPNGASIFGAAVDNAVMKHVRGARQVLSGPEVLLAYIVARLVEIKNLRIAYTALVSKLDHQLIVPMLRRPYIEKGA